MAVTVTTKNYKKLSGCESAADGGTWTGNSIGTESDFKKEGTNCLGFTLRTIGNNDMNLAFSPSQNWNSPDYLRHLRVWILNSTPGFIETDANGGIQFYVGDGTNTGYWKVSGKTTYPGGWYNLVMDLDQTPDSGTAPNFAAVTVVGVRVVLTGAPKNVDNTWLDNLILCDGLIAYGDDAGGTYSLANILAADENLANGWGIIRKISGVYYAVGSITNGDAGSNNTKFKDTSQILIFEDRKVNSNLYAFNAKQGTGSTEFQLGNMSGGKGIQGCIIKAAGMATFSMTATDAFTAYKLYGSSFIKGGIISLPANADGREVLSCNFEVCGKVIPDTCVVEYCNFVSAEDDAVTVSSTTLNLKNSNFINPTNHGIEITQAGEYDFYGLKFSGTSASGPYDVENTTVGMVTINNKDGSNTQHADNSGGGSTDIVTPVTLTLKGLPDNTEVSIVKVSDRTELFHQENSSGDVIYNYGTAQIGLVVDILAVHLNYDPNLGQIFDYTLGPENATIPISLVSDPTYYNP